MWFRKKTKVGVFIDGQNTFQECRDVYNHGSIHPLLLGHRLLDDGERLVMVHYHSGQHTDGEKEEEIKWNNARYDFMKQTGVETHIKNVKYAWKWMIEDKSKLPNPNRSKGRKRNWQVKSAKVAREKGIDTGLVLDAIVMIAAGQIDKAIIISADSDVAEAIEASKVLDKFFHSPKSFREDVWNKRRSEVIVASFAPWFKEKEQGDANYRFLDKDDFDASKDIIPYLKSGDEDLNRKEAEFLKINENKVKYFPRDKKKEYKSNLKRRSHLI